MTLSVIQHLRTRDYSDMTDQIARILYDVAFAGVVDEIRATDPQTAKIIKVQNAPMTALEKALQSGRVQYVGGVFSGNFSAQIAVDIRKLGGKFDKNMKVYFIDKIDVPGWVKAASEDFNSKSRALHKRILDILDKAQSTLDDVVDERKLDAIRTLDRVQEGFRGAADAIGVSPKITQASKDRLAKEYSENVKLYIKDFSRSSIQSLRKVVEQNAQKGYRFEGLIETIQLRYGVTKRKAEFLARQETALFMAKYREMRFAEGGVERYVWHTAHDEKVRHRHAELDGRTFFYSDPPVVSAHGVVPVRRGNPGQDYNCRCVDSPVVDRFEKAA